jgi:hypothetical protein
VDERAADRSSEHAARIDNIAAEPAEDSKNSRRLIPLRRAARSLNALVRRAASRAISFGGGG